MRCCGASRAKARAVLASQDADASQHARLAVDALVRNYGEETARAIARAHRTARAARYRAERFGRDRGLPDSEPLFGNVVAAARSRPRSMRLPGFAKATGGCRISRRLCRRGCWAMCSGKTVIDLCAAPGGKTVQLAARGAQVIAVEREAARMARLKENLARLKLDGDADRSRCARLYAGARAPFVLLDAPCTATGTIRRHPELPWIKSAADVNACARRCERIARCSGATWSRRAARWFSRSARWSAKKAKSRSPISCGATADFARAPITAEEVFGHGGTRSPPTAICAPCPAISPNKAAWTAFMRRGSERL